MVERDRRGAAARRWIGRRQSFKHREFGDPKNGSDKIEARGPSLLVLRTSFMADIHLYVAIVFGSLH
jgi:hypothetical protein